LDVTRTLRGVRTVVRRRGIGYLGYLVTGVALPRLAYAVGWGAAASPLARALFHAAARIATTPAPPARARELGAALRAATTIAEPEPSVSAEGILDRAHAEGVTGLAVFFKPAEHPHDPIDLRHVRLHRKRGVLFMMERDRDRAAFNDTFGASLLTEASARRLLRDVKATLPSGYRDYGPIDFGGGLTVGEIASTDSGTGRWDFFTGPVVAPLVAGRRVLDLGSNNGSLPLMMLRAGARRVVGIEGDPAIAAFARLNARILAWRDLRDYDIEIVAGDMRLCVTSELGQYDVVTAFCSLYYLPEEDMARVIRKAAGMRAALVLQANESIDNLPAKARDLRRLMTDNGYPDVHVHDYPGFARPLLVGTVSASISASPRPAGAEVLEV
jgi:SAM-dependent methyltransferase